MRAEMEKARARARTEHKIMERLARQINRDWDDLHVDFRERLRNVFDNLERRGYKPVLNEGRRSSLRQEWLYAQGRTRPGDIVTNADGVHEKSYHQSGKAADIYFRDEKGRWREPTPEEAQALGEAAKSEGLRWGGSWKKPYDPVHVEYRSEPIMQQPAPQKPEDRYSVHSSGTTFHTPDPKPQGSGEGEDGYKVFGIAANVSTIADAVLEEQQKAAAAKTANQELKAVRAVERAEEARAGARMLESSLGTSLADEFKRIASRAQRAAGRADDAAERARELTRSLAKAKHVNSILGPAMTTADQYLNSTAVTPLGKALDSGLATWMDSKVNPSVALFDAVMGLYPGADQYTISNHMSTSVRAIVTLSEAIGRWDAQGIESFHARSLGGEYGPLFQAASQAGDYYTEHGVVGGFVNPLKSLRSLLKSR